MHQYFKKAVTCNILKRSAATKNTLSLHWHWTTEGVLNLVSSTHASLDLKSGFLHPCNLQLWLTTDYLRWLDWICNVTSASWHVYDTTQTLAIFHKIKSLIDVFQWHIMRNVLVNQDFLCLENRNSNASLFNNQHLWKNLEICLSLQKPVEKKANDLWCNSFYLI